MPETLDPLRTDHCRLANVSEWKPEPDSAVVVALHASPRTQLTGQIFPTPLKLETTSFFGKHQNWQRQMCLVLYYTLANAFSIAYSLKRCDA